MPKKSAKKTTRKTPPSAANNGRMQTGARFSPEDIAAAVYDTKTGMPVKQTETVSYGFGLKGVSMNVNLTECLCKIIEYRDGTSITKQHYIGVDRNGVIINPIVSGANASARAGWTPVSQEDFNMYYTDIKHMYSSINISNIRRKYQAKPAT